MIAGRYRLHSVLGSGSMGTVWSAYDEFLLRPVAVKEVRLPPGFPAAQAEELRERTLREARAIASLSHPNVITLHDVVREDDEPFVVMEQLTARSLAGLLADHGALSTEQAATIGDAVAAALEAAHAAGITHRDVKPGNVLVARDGRVKLTDFGIARNISEATMTSTGLMLGSPAYMAPEVASGKRVTAAADLWGLGATLYALLEGHPPYDAGGDPLATAHAVVHDEVPRPREGPLTEVITSLMSKDPGARPTLGEVRRWLAGLAARPDQPLFPPALFDREPGVTADAHGTEVLGDDQPTSYAGEAAPVPTAEGATTEAGEGTAALAADPGPLPFAPAARTARPEVRAVPRRRRGPLTTAVLALVALLVFAAATAGGFALARRLGGAEVLPAGLGQVVQSPTATSPARRFVRHTGEATMLKGDDAARFRVSMPAGWTRFVTQQPAAVLPPSTLVQFVSVDGRQALNIERFPVYFPVHDLDGYLKALESFWEPDFVRVSWATRPGGRHADLTYRTVETAETTGPDATADAGKLGRTTFARLIRSDSSLWVVSVTVPTDQETRARGQLFDKIAPTFTTL